MNGDGHGQSRAFRAIATISLSFSLSLCVHMLQFIRTLLYSVYKLYMTYVIQQTRVAVTTMRYIRSYIAKDPNTLHPKCGRKQNNCSIFFLLHGVHTIFLLFQASICVLKEQYCVCESNWKILEVARSDPKR